MISRLMRTVLLVLAVVATTSLAHAAWLGTGAEQAPDITVRDLGAGRTEIDVVVPGIMTDVVTIDGTDHAKIVLPEHVQLLDRGSPQLPYITTSLIIPGEGTPRVQVVDRVYREYQTAPIVPAKGPIPRTVDPKTVPYEFGPAYAGGVFPAKIASVADPYIVRNVRGVNVRLYPVQWDADRGVLRVLERVTLEVVTDGKGGVNQLVKKAPATRTFEALYTQQFANYDEAAKYDLPAGEGRMLIVCYDAFMGAMQPFADWKRERGLDVEMISTSSVGGTTGGIKAAIQQRYDSPEGLVFVILVGDGQQLPSYSGAYEGANDDTRYVRLDGTDVYPDALISRISAQTPTQVQTQVTKIVTYERDITGPADWTHMAAGVASNEGSPTDATRMDWIRDDLLAYTFTDVDRIYQGQGGTTQWISDAVNEGRSIVNYLGHGSGTAWSSVYFNNSNVHALTNTAWPWIIDVACLNGGIGAIGESFDEAWMRAGSPAQPYGAVGVYGSSTSCSWVPPTVMQAESIDLLVAETSNVLGVLMHAGIMEVLDEYGTSGVGLQMVEQYNLFGDCSMMVRTDSPGQMSVAHEPVVPLMSPTYTVDAGVEGASVTLSGNGVIYGTGVTDAFGEAQLVMINDLDTIGDATLTVFGYNQETYQQIVQVVVPANVTIDPATVPVGETTTVIVTVTDPDTELGMDDVMIDVVGFGFSAAAVQTDGNGQVSFEVTPQFGEALGVRGQEIGTSYFMFNEGLTVTGATALGDPSVTASVPSIGMDGTLTPHIEGQVAAYTRDTEYSLHLQGGGLALTEATSGNDLVVNVTPTELTPVMATLTKPGFEIHQTEIIVVEAFGTLAGTVRDGDDGGAVLTGARIVGYPEGVEPGGTPLFDLLTNAQGQFTVPDELAVGFYDLYVTKFGYLPYQETYFLLFGANDHGIDLSQAASGVMTGFVTAADSGDPLEATVRIFRTDNGELYDEAATDASGEYTTGPLPYFDYQVDVRASGRIPVSSPVTIDAAQVPRDFALDPTSGNILVLNDNSSEPRQMPAKYDEFGNLIAPAYTAGTDRAAADLVADLETLGFSVSMESAAVSDPSNWELYDVVLASSGANTGGFDSAILRSNLTAYSENGGRLLVEGGEIAYNLNWSDPTFLENVLHVSGWSGDSSGDVIVAEADHPVMSSPNVIVGPIDNDYSGYGDADRAPVASDAVMVGAWSSYSSTASVVAYDDNDNVTAGQFVFFMFNYSAMGDERDELLMNAIVWLLADDTIDPTPVEDQPEALPRVVSLDTNYPNPFNPQTLIRFAVPSSQTVKLAIYDVRGQRVRTLVDDVVAAGRHEVVWQGRDDTGRQVASGTYFYRLQTDGTQQVKKMLLVK